MNRKGEEKMMKEEKNKTNWKRVGIGVAIIAAITFILLSMMNIPSRITVYCQFNSTIIDAAARDQCAMMKIVSSDIGKVNIHQFEKFGRCSEDIEGLPKCEGFETYHFSKYNLEDLCKEENCEVDGVICNAFFLTYHNASNPSREEFESGYFTQANVESEEKLMQLFNRCNAGGWLPWS